MHRFRSRFVVSSSVGALLSSPVLAHDGHGAMGVERGWLHWLLEPQHGVVVLGAAVLVVGLMRWTLRPSAVRRACDGERPRR